MRLNLFKLRVLFLWWVVTLSAYSETGIELLRARLPRFVQALEKVLTEKQISDFLSNWTSEEVDELATRLSEVNKNKGNVSGEIGEAALLPWIREEASKRGARYLYERQYSRLNSGSRPDGLLYDIRREKLIIFGVAESKISYSSYFPEQMEQYLRRWKQIGITVLDGEAPKKFPPQEIFFRGINEDGDLVEYPVSELEPNLLERNSILQTTEALTKANWGHRKLPFIADQIHRISNFYINNPDSQSFKKIPLGMKFSKGKIEGEAEKRELVMGQLSGKDTRPELEKKPEEKVVGPNLKDKKSLERFLVELDMFVLSRGHRPKVSSKDRFEQYLSKGVDRRGWGEIFVFELSPESRHTLAEAGNVPILHTLEKPLLQGDPNFPQIQSVLRAILRQYYPTGSLESIPLLQSLSEKSEKWRSFLKATDLSSFRLADLGDMVECLRRLGQLAPKQNLPVEPRP